MPPLNSTTALRESFIFLFFPARSNVTLNTLRGWVPHKFMRLQTKPHGQTIRKDPFNQRSRLQPLPLPFRIVKNRRKENRVHAFRQPVLRRKLAREFVVPARRDHELHFIVRAQSREVSHFKSIRLAGVRAFHVHNLDDLGWQASQVAFPAGLDHYRIPRGEQFFRQRIDFFLEKRLPSGQFHQGNSSIAAEGPGLPSRQVLDARENLIDAHFFAAMEGIGRIAPSAAKITPRQPYEDARQSRACAFSLNGFENFCDNHGLLLSRFISRAGTARSSYPFPTRQCPSPALRAATLSFAGSPHHKNTWLNFLPKDSRQIGRAHV